RNADSDAGNAYNMLKAVYPGHSDRQLAETDPAVLANHATVREVIGSTIVIEEEKCDKFYAKIQAYVDSEEKRGKKTAEAEPKEAEPK
ncbi:hypothetical protein, partial [Salmonella enterica]|uniref:hypothetical protein n=1 Tax=Salmonella enterica TaxID=28901 RepID=UPI0020C4FBC2